MAPHTLSSFYIIYTEYLLLNVENDPSFLQKYEKIPDEILREIFFFRD